MDAQIIEEFKAPGTHRSILLVIVNLHSFHFNLVDDEKD